MKSFGAFNDRAADGRICACHGPQNGEPLCPCMMREVKRDLDGNLVRVAPPLSFTPLGVPKEWMPRRSRGAPAPTNHQAPIVCLACNHPPSSCACC